jgi:glycosyltransferase involved in cell wall biosynthesis
MCEEGNSGSPGLPPGPAGGGRLRVVVPAFEAARTVAAVAREALALGYPVTVVDDGSTDGTAAALSGLPVEILSHPENRGKGAALRTGFARALAAGEDGVVTLDADGQHDPGAVPLLVAAARRTGAAIVIASRRGQFASMSRLRGSWNRFGAWCMKRLTGFDVPDSQSGLRLYSAEALRRVPFRSDGYDAEMELLLGAWRAGLSIASVDAPARVADGRSTSHFRAVADTWRICMTFLRLAFPGGKGGRTRAGGPPPGTTPPPGRPTER